MRHQELWLLRIFCPAQGLNGQPCQTLLLSEKDQEFEFLILGVDLFDLPNASFLVVHLVSDVELHLDDLLTSLHLGQTVGEAGLLLFGLGVLEHVLTVAGEDIGPGDMLHFSAALEALAGSRLSRSFQLSYLLATMQLVVRSAQILQIRNLDAHM